MSEVTGKVEVICATGDALCEVLLILILVNTESKRVEKYMFYQHDC